MTSEAITATALVIEDEKEIRRFLRGTLLDAGFTVHEADSLRAGLVEAATRVPDIVILDLGLPDGDGVDFIRDVRTWSNVPNLRIFMGNLRHKSVTGGAVSLRTEVVYAEAAAAGPNLPA